MPSDRIPIERIASFFSGDSEQSSWLYQRLVDLPVEDPWGQRYKICLLDEVTDASGFLIGAYFAGADLKSAQT